MKTVLKVLAVLAVVAGVVLLVCALCRHNDETAYIPLDTGEDDV